MRRALATVSRALDVDPPHVAVTGPEDALPGPFRVTDAATATVAAATSAAAELLRARGIDPGPISVDTRHAATAFRSEQHVAVDGRQDWELWAPLSGLYRAADGWVRLHGNYPHHASAACRALGVTEDRSAVEAEVARWAAWDVQEAVIAEGGAAAAVRTAEQWATHPQGHAVRDAPLIGIDRLGDAPAAPLPPGDRPLAGVRVVELTHVIAGPVAGRVLAAHGADVLHIGAAHLPDLPPVVADTGFGKRSAHLDLRAEQDRDRLRGLISQADVVLHSYRPGALDAKGFDAATLAALRPGIVSVALSAYGWRGPWATRRGFDSLVQCATGIAAECGTVTRPAALPAQALDHATGWLAAAAAMTLLHRRTREGGSWRARLALAHTAAWLDSLGRTAGADVAPHDDLLTETPSAIGTVTHVRMPGTVPAAPPRWTHGPHAAGADPAAWW
ncbi:CoA transferase [Haloechinothrix halophila]|uniref:CoA transferase n=1 Tax=Haloechinothrix halophila TaxID=1069073 RepID=UPI0003FAA76B|nr:CoA transferase [Haloechinothrix halophila]